MPALHEIEKQVKSLPQDEYENFRKWFCDYDYKIWDKEIKKDSQSGALNFLIKEAMDEKRLETLKDL